MVNRGTTDETTIWNLQSVIFALCVTVSWDAHAQQRPLVTEDPETIGAGQVLLEGGFSFDTDQTNFANGLKGDITRFASFGASIGHRRRPPRSRSTADFFSVST